MSDLDARWTVIEIGERPDGFETYHRPDTAEDVLMWRGVEVGWVSHLQKVIGGELIIDWDDLRKQMATRLASGRRAGGE